MVWFLLKEKRDGDGRVRRRSSLCLDLQQTLGRWANFVVGWLSRKRVPRHICVGAARVSEHHRSEADLQYNPQSKNHFTDNVVYVYTI